MPKLVIKHNESLEIANNKMRVRMSLKSGTSLTRTKEGLYAEAKPGRDGSSGNGYPDGYQSANVLISGVKNFVEFNIPVSGRIAAHPIVHRIFDATNENGDGIPLREVDTLYPGDMYRYHDNTHNGWVYRIILSTDGKNIKERSAIVAAIPDEYTDVN